MDDATGTMKSAIGSATKALPAETIDNICEYLTSDDILSLRAVCRDTCRKVEDTFLSRFFSHRRQLISKPSLKQFLDISAHPILRRKLKSVEFVKAELSSKWRPCYGPWQNRNNRWAYGQNGGRATDEEEHMKRIHWLEEEEKMVDKWHDYTKHLGDLIELEEITLALKNLKEASILPALAVSGDLWDGIRGNNPAHGVHELHRVLGLAIEKHHPHGSHHDFVGYRPFTGRLSSGAEATKLLLKSIAEAEFPMQDLTMSSETNPVCFTDFKFVDRPDLDDALRSSMIDLRRLSFTCDTQIDRLDTEELEAFLSAAPLLQTLIINFDYRGPSIPDGIRTAFANIKLRSLEFTDARFSRHTLNSIFASQQDTLQDLRLNLVGLKELEHSWKSILEYLATGFSLNRISLYLRQGRSCIGSCLYHEGTAAVQLGLAELIAEAERKQLRYENDEDEDEDGQGWRQISDEEYYEYAYKHEYNGEIHYDNDEEYYYDNSEGW